jgi:hypothetical protein
MSLILLHVVLSTAIQRETELLIGMTLCYSDFCCQGLVCRVPTRDQPSVM